MIEAFKENPILLLFLVAAIGYGLGSIRLQRSSLGVAAVLFVGLGFGALDPELHIPDMVVFLGLAIFVYTIGLQSGPSFFSNLRRRGLRDVTFVLFMLSLSAGITLILHFVLGLEAATTAGLFAGVSTNTPALAGLLDAINSTASEALIKPLSELGVVGYSLSYPMGVLGVMLSINLMSRILRIDFKAEETSLQDEYPSNQSITGQTVEVTNEKLMDIPIRDLMREHNWKIVFGRMLRNEQILLPNWDTSFQKGDIVRVVGNEEAIHKVVQMLGHAKANVFPSDDTDYEIKRIYVSNPKVAGQKLAALNLAEKFPMLITRISRGDMDLLANGETILELGDRVLFICRKKDSPALVRMFGDSFEALSHINLLSFGLGMALGLLLGMVTFQFPGGFRFQLGYAGGPLIVALLLGTLRRTGPVVWTLPHSANLTLRQIGLIFLLAGIGINSGHTFLNTLSGGSGGYLFLAGAIISISANLTTLLIGYKLFKIPFSFLMGMVSNQPAILDFALNKTGNKLPTIGFTTMLPVALIAKILFVQLLFAFLS
ncbi:MAG: TrkA C-terminal domain-containing protein [Bacteroidota bacterium]